MNVTHLLQSKIRVCQELLDSSPCSPRPPCLCVKKFLNHNLRGIKNLCQSASIKRGTFACLRQARLRFCGLIMVPTPVPATNNQQSALQLWFLYLPFALFKIFYQLDTWDFIILAKIKQILTNV